MEGPKTDEERVCRFCLKSTRSQALNLTRAKDEATIKSMFLGRFDGSLQGTTHCEGNDVMGV